VIERLIWDETNTRKLLTHGITQDEVWAMVEHSGYVFDNPGYPGQIRLVGYTPTGRWLTVAMEPLWHLGQNVWRPVTGWDAEPREIAEYSAEEGP
jgi:hypothetical protein